LGLRWEKTGGSDFLVSPAWSFVWSENGDLTVEDAAADTDLKLIVKQRFLKVDNAQVQQFALQYEAGVCY